MPSGEIAYKWWTGKAEEKEALARKRETKGWLL
jgi:hypothetical protein